MKNYVIHYHYYKRTYDWTYTCGRNARDAVDKIVDELPDDAEVDYVEEQDCDPNDPRI